MADQPDTFAAPDGQVDAAERGDDDTGIAGRTDEPPVVVRTMWFFIERASTP
jgi:hypothetical protein